MTTSMIYGCPHRLATERCPHGCHDIEPSRDTLGGTQTPETRPAITHVEYVKGWSAGPT